LAVDDQTHKYTGDQTSSNPITIVDEAHMIAPPVVLNYDKLSASARSKPITNTTGGPLVVSSTEFGTVTVPNGYTATRVGNSWTYRSNKSE